MRTTQESTRAPSEDEKRAGRLAELMDQQRFRHVLVEDKIPGVAVNFRNVDWYRRNGYEVVSTDTQVTGFEGLTLMAISHEEFDHREEERSKRDNRGHVEEDDREAFASGLRDGVVVRESRSLKLSEMGAQLPTRSEVEMREAQAEFNAMTLQEVDPIRRAASLAASEAKADAGS